jgi:glyoxylate reductase
VPRIVVTRRIPEPALEVLREAGEVWVAPGERPLSPESLRAAVAGADALVTLIPDRIDDAVLAAAGPSLRVVATVAAGYDNLDVAAAARRGVVVTNTPGVLTEATADLAMALILMTTRRLGEGERLVRAGRPWGWDLGFMLGTGLQGATLGLVGFGGIARATARRARAAGMEVRYTARHRAEAGAEAEVAAERRPLEALLAESDVVSLHVPLTPETRHLIDATALRRMRPSAYLVNTARGAIVDEPALAEALAGGVIAGAGLDVFEHEPTVHPALLRLENVVLLPHLGSATAQTRTAMAVLAARNAAAVLRGEDPPTPVSPGGRP